jgi:hypothetical protein
LIAAIASSGVIGLSGTDDFGAFGTLAPANKATDKRTTIFAMRVMFHSAGQPGRNRP